MDMKIIKQHGFTLVEIIVVMAILSVVMMAVMSMIIPMQKTAAIQGKVAEVQDNLQVSFDVIGKDIRNAGFLTTGVPHLEYNLNRKNPLTGVADTCTDTLKINTRAVRVDTIKADFYPGDLSPSFDNVPTAVEDDIVLTDFHLAEFFKPGSFVAIFNAVDPAHFVGNSTYKIVWRSPSPASTHSGYGIKIKKTNNTNDTTDDVDIVLDEFNDKAKGSLIIMSIPRADVSPADTLSQIEYRYDATNNALIRQVTNPMSAAEIQYVARNVSSTDASDPDGDPGADVFFCPETTVMSNGDVDSYKVKVFVLGKTAQFGQDKSTSKERMKHDVFTLRNI